ncbi:hypothetical protein B0I35DRAFT_273013 [Stachybotrys elegans]|uniref:Uncharacterized protein n=1 Tax=Stachybotrys elegans TaxID=80388 RepID=A0A8K0WPL0_9HYPO|nr:hypothetical protein B0I35DRAFT_273013 [Stachybotrys elegans]
MIKGDILPCATTNVMNFTAEIPSASFPSGGPYGLDYILFDIAANGSVYYGSPLGTGLNVRELNLTGGTGEWSDFAKEYGNWGIENRLRLASCDAVPCIQDCQTQLVEPNYPFVLTNHPELDACVEECYAASPIPPFQDVSGCVTENAVTEPPTPSSTSSEVSTVSTGAPTQTEGTAPGGDDSSAGSPLLPFSTGLFIFSCAAVIFTYSSALS